MFRLCVLLHPIFMCFSQIFFCERNCMSTQAQNISHIYVPRFQNHTLNCSTILEIKINWKNTPNSKSNLLIDISVKEKNRKKNVEKSIGYRSIQNRNNETVLDFVFVFEKKTPKHKHTKTLNLNACSVTKHSKFFFLRANKPFSSLKFLTHKKGDEESIKTKTRKKMKSRNFGQGHAIQMFFLRL